MSLEVVLTIVLAVVIGYSLLAKWLSTTIITLPMIFALTGLVLALVMDDPEGRAELHDVARLVAEATLIIVLFADASHVRFRQLEMSYQIPLRMLVIGMPLTLIFGTIVVKLVSPAEGWAMALLTAAILTPTDAALGQPVVTSPDVPQKLSQSINVESGLNDGLALPFVLVGAIFSSIGAASHEGGIAAEAIREVILGPLAGAAVGAGAAWALDRAAIRSSATLTSGGVVFLATAFLAYLVALLIGGNGFIAAFVAGAVFGNRFRHDISFISEFMEGQGQILTMAAFLIYGAVLLPDSFAHMSWVPMFIAVMFLTVVRMLPIWISLTGTGLAAKEKLFLGWFGPRGLASILFALIMIDEFELPFEEELLGCVVMTVFLSIILHGVSAAPLARRIGK